jgi:hypothetical protein
LVTFFVVPYCKFLFILLINLFYFDKILKISM